MRRMKGREIGNEEFQELKNGLDRYANIEGTDARFVNIPTVTTGLNEDGTIREEVMESYAYEIIEQGKRVND